MSDTLDVCVELRGITHRYGRTAAVRSVSLQIRKGEFFSLLGPSGCGKTTTSFYLTVGPYDLVAILEAPNDDLVGNVHTTSFKAFPEAEYRRLITGSTASTGGSRTVTAPATVATREPETSEVS